ncbi:zinc finger protein CONSTANS-LIKE 16 [Diospyros lotus]|uniref:zinc finger protein CONSTANS-LIKE 16 n=1 Tax=Diospyros lotus TaxID=55363 RepID=UPI00224FC1EE|nr:zinc finger protein CONSTANS-LIKE 16 [Diospyros lotus]
MRHSSLPGSPKKEEQEVPAQTSTVSEFSSLIDDLDHDQGILSVEGEEEKSSGQGNKDMCGQVQLGWKYFMDWEGFSVGDEEEEEEEEDDDDDDDEEGDQKVAETSMCLQGDSRRHCSTAKRESYGFWDDYDHDYVDNGFSLNLSLNYQGVLDAWSDRRTLLADGHYCSSLTIPNNNNGAYIGEVPVMEEERARREASVQRYKEKRQTRLFSKKIRYQVRKLNAEKRPRLKGRFVKRGSSREDT